MGKIDSHFDKMLVSYIEQHPCLYDRRHVYYKHRDRARTAWLEVADRLETTVEVVETRWKALKRSFTKTLRQNIPEAQSCKKSLNKNCLAFPCFESMLWLVPYIKNYDKTSSTRKKIKCPVHGTIDLSTEKSSKSQNVEEPSAADLDENVTDQQNSTFSSESSFFQKSCNRNGRNIIKIENERDDKCTQTDNFKDTQKKNYSYKYQPNAQCPSSLNADVNFMISVVSDMQMISPKRKIKFKREVFELLEKNIFEEKN